MEYTLMAFRKKPQTAKPVKVPARYSWTETVRRMQEAIDDPRGDYKAVLDERIAWYESHGWEPPEHYGWRGQELPEGHPDKDA